MGNKSTKIIAKRNLDCDSNLDYYNKYFIPRHFSIMEESFLEFGQPFRFLTTKQLINFVFIYIENESCLKMEPKEHKNDQERYKYWEMMHFIRRENCNEDVCEHFLYDYPNIQKRKWYNEKRTKQRYDFLLYTTKRENWYPDLINEVKSRKDFDKDKFGGKIKKLQDFHENI
jgi:hypothetical protein